METDKELSIFDEELEKYDKNNLKYNNYVELLGYEKKNKNAIPMWVADMDFKICQQLQQEYNNMINNLQKLQISNEQMAKESKQCIINWVKRRHLMNIQEEEIIFTQNAVNSYLYALNSITQKGDKFLIITPTYYMLAIMSNCIGRVPVESQFIVNEQGDLIIDFQDIQRKLQDKSIKALVITNPNNPCGKVYYKEELQKLGEICQKHNLYVICDDIFSDYVYEGNKYENMANVVNQDFKKNIITCQAPSKIFNVSGVGVSFLIVHNQEIKNNIIRQQLKSGTSQELSHVSYYTYKGAYSEQGEQWVIKMNQYVKENYEALKSIFQKENIKNYVQILNQYGTYLLVLKYKGMSSQTLMEKVLKKNNLIVQSMEGFYFPSQPGIQEIRFNIALPRKKLVQACNIFAESFLQNIEN